AASSRGGVASAGVSSSAGPAGRTTEIPISSPGIGAFRSARSASRMLVPPSAASYVEAMRSLSRVPRAITKLTAVILLSAAACEKSKPAKNPADVIIPEGVAALDLAGKPQILFQIFGERESPHMMPIGAIVNGAIKPIGLTLSGWKQLDAQYMAAGTKYPFYVEGGDPGELTVTRDTAYSLPGCSAVKPMAVVQLAFKTPHADPTVEFVASSGAAVPPRRERGTLMTSADIAKLARSIGHAAGKRVNLSPAELDSLDFHARMIATGASQAPTMLISFIDPNSGNARGGGWTGHVRSEEHTSELQSLTNLVCRLL